MKFVLFLLGAGQMVYGLLVFNMAESSIHEVYGAVLFGSGSVCFGLGAILNAMASRPVTLAAASEPVASAPAPPRPGDRIKIYKGKEIIKAESGVTVNGQPFQGLITAEKFIDAQRSE